MAASDSVHANAPPLPHSQRTRLLKSSRKIEAMLGTTPLVLQDVDLSPQTYAKPRLERSRSKPGKGPQPVPQPVLLRSRSVALPSLIPSSPHVKSSSLDTAGATSSGSGPSTPLSAMFSPITKETNDAKEREMRRKKMAKITRTLGENIPPELIFGSSYHSNNNQQESRYSSPKNAAAGKTHRPGRLSVSSSSNSNSRSAEVIGDTTYPGAIEEGEMTPNAATTYTASSSSLSLTSSESSSGHDHNVTISAPFSPSASATATPTASTFDYHYTKASSHHTLPTPTSTSTGASTVHRSRSQRTIAGYYPVYHAGPSVSSTPAIASNTLELAPEPSPAFSTSSLSASVDSYYGSGSPLQRAASTSSSMAPLLQQQHHDTAATATAVAVAGARSAKSLDVQRSSTFTNFQDLHHDTSNEVTNPVDYVWGTRRQKGATQVYNYGHEANVGAEVYSTDGDAGGGRKKEKEWSGEWNVKDMGDVVKKLRELKGR